MAQEKFTVFDLEHLFPDEESCVLHLVKLKWGNGYECSKCAHELYKQGSKKNNRRCKSCGYEESPTAHTLFHKIKFPLRKAFFICYQLSVNKKGMSTLEIARQYGLTQKTSWYFKRKVQKAMQSSDKYPLDGDIEVDEFVVGAKEEGKPGRSHGKKRKLILGIETVLNKKGELTIGRAYSRLINDYSTNSFMPFFEDKISKHANIFTDLWSSYKPIAKEYNIEQELSDGGKNMILLHTHIMNIKSWIRGVHHHISNKHAQAYMDEFHYKFNRRLGLKKILNTTLSRMVENEWFSYSMAIQAT